MKTNSKSPAKNKKNKINNVDKPNLKVIKLKIQKNHDDLENTFVAIGEQLSKISDYSKINFDQKKEELTRLMQDQENNRQEINELKKQLHINEQKRGNWLFCPTKDGSILTEDYNAITKVLEIHERCKRQLKSELEKIDKNDTAQKDKIKKDLKHHLDEIERLQQLLVNTKAKIMAGKTETIARIEKRLLEIDHQKQIDKIQNKLNTISKQQEDLQQEDLHFVDALFSVSDKVFASRQQDPTVIQNFKQIKTELFTLKKDLLEQNTTNLLNYDNDAKNNEIKKNNLQDSFTDNEISFTDNEISFTDNKIKNLEIEVNFETNKKRIDFLDKLINIANLIEKSIKIKSELQKLQEKKANLKKSEPKPKYSIYSVSELMQGSLKKNINNFDKNKSLDSDKKTKGRK